MSSWSISYASWSCALSFVDHVKLHERVDVMDRRVQLESLSPLLIGAGLGSFISRCCVESGVKRYAAPTRRDSRQPLPPAFEFFLDDES
jgi:hypothetical protein